MLTYSYKSAQAYFVQQLSDLYDTNEIRQLLKMIFEYYLCFKSTDFLVKQDELQDEAFSNQLDQVVHRLQNGEPIQYILQQAWFRDLKLEVLPSVLIPRQETEELISWIVDGCKNTRIDILDIGTGSGCIALALKNEMPESEVMAWDVSTDALNVAVGNSKLNHLDIRFQLQDILSVSANQYERRFDLIVSNPPYVLHQEKEHMHVNVLHYEPHLALFVDDHDPLIFYSTIAQKAQTMLKPNGWLYFEINESKGEDMVKLLQGMGYIRIELRQDINGKDRMVRAMINL